MANNKMLIDATHLEETRVVVVRGNRVEEFDFESASRRPLRGNIYLAKVTRVEPSLQAAFVEYGGNRHGFLAFSEIHPDYYQIPVADREALLAADARDEAAAEAAAERRSKGGERRRPEASRRSAPDPRRSEPAENGEEPNGGEGEPHGAGEESDAVVEAAAPSETAETSAEGAGEPGGFTSEALIQEDGIAPIALAVEEELQPPAVEAESRPDAAEADTAAEIVETARTDGGDESSGESRGDIVEVAEDDEGIEQVGGDALEELPERPQRRHRSYKIQEVIRRRQIMLVQVVKEERGTKGAALTTYLSLAGRYAVLMPNTARGGGISRKITDGQDRKRLKEIVGDLEVPEGMGIILRTAGASRTKTEIKRDFEYLLRLWETVRDLTLKSSAPALVYEEGSLIKRSIRDLYNKDIDEVLVAGEEGYREAKDFMRMLMPSHAKVVQPYRDPRPLFARYDVESQLDAMFSPQVTLRSGGYIVINQTEALVAIDVNSGRSTREHNIEDTALRTNLEAAEEIARQLRLRDLAGLIVIDFIDMDENRNNRSVERKLKDALKSDRARIQVGRISHFGLMEMSRQRIRTGVLESSSEPCPHCGGTGSVRSNPSVALHVLRLVDDHLRKDASRNLNVRVRAAIAMYVLNQKRTHLLEIEQRYGVTVLFVADETLGPHQHAVIEKGELVTEEARAAATLVRVDSVHPIDVEDEDEEDVVEVEVEAEAEAETEEVEASTAEADAAGSANGGSRRRRRRRRKPGVAAGGEQSAHAEPAEDAHAVIGVAEDDDEGDEDEDEAAEASEDRADSPAGDANGPTPRRRRGRRGGKRSRRSTHPHSDAPAEPHDEDRAAPEARAAIVGDEDAGPDAVAEPLPFGVEDGAAVAEPAAESPLAAEAPEPVAAYTYVPHERPEPMPSFAELETAPAPIPERPETLPEPAEGNGRETERPAILSDAAESAPAETPPAPVAEPVDDRPRRSGWWQRRVLGG